MFDPDPTAMAPDDASEVCVIPAAFGADPDPAAAILEASPQVELFDEEVWGVPKKGFRPLVADSASDGVALRKTLSAVLERGAVPLVLGASTDCFAGAEEWAEPVSILHLSATPDLAPGCLMRKAVEAGHTVVAAGLRRFSPEEAAFIPTLPSSYRPFRAFGQAGYKAGEQGPAIAAALGKGPRLVAIDLSVFDAAIMPAVAEPEPGGLSWPTVTAILKASLVGHPVAGIFLWGLRPHPSLHAADFLAAKLAYKLLTYAFASENAF